jgi:hypothetical protein
VEGPERARLEAHLDATMAWLCRAQDVTPDGGVSAGYTLLKGWAPSFPETTGYLIPTFINYGARAGNARFEARAEVMGDWLLGLQRTEGGFHGGLVDRASAPNVFDTGQIMLGLLRLHAATGKREHLDACIRAGNWLVSIQEDDGGWPGAFDFLGKRHAYNTRVAWALALLAEASGEESFARAAGRHLDWALTQVGPDGFVERCAFDPLEEGKRRSFVSRARLVLEDKNLPSFYTRASLHTLAYALNGLLECGWRLKRADAESAALRGARALAAGALGGRLAGFYGRGWRPEANSRCLTGIAQIAIVWLRLAAHGHAGFLEPADAAIKMLVRAQQRGSGWPDLRGALAGSDPVWGLYLPFRYPNWAAKFAADAYLLRLEHGTPREAEVTIS